MIPPFLLRFNHIRQSQIHILATYGLMTMDRGVTFVPGLSKGWAAGQISSGS